MTAQLLDVVLDPNGKDDKLKSLIFKFDNGDITLHDLMDSTIKLNGHVRTFASLTSKEMISLIGKSFEHIDKDYVLTDHLV